jgi:hypothetical protein
MQRYCFFETEKNYFALTANQSEVSYDDFFHQHLFDLVRGFYKLFAPDKNLRIFFEKFDFCRSDSDTTVALTGKVFFSKNIRNVNKVSLIILMYSFLTLVGQLHFCAK